MKIYGCKVNHLERFILRNYIKKKDVIMNV